LLLKIESFSTLKEKKYRSGVLVGIPRNFFFDEKKFPKSTDQVFRSVFHFRFWPKMALKLSYLDPKKIWEGSLIFSLQPWPRFGVGHCVKFGEKWI